MKEMNTSIFLLHDSDTHRSKKLEGLKLFLTDEIK